MAITDEDIKQYKINKMQNQLKKISDQREKNVNRYILPLEIKMSELRDKIRAKGADPVH